MRYALMHRQCSLALGRDSRIALREFKVCREMIHGWNSSVGRQGWRKSDVKNRENMRVLIGGSHTHTPYSMCSFMQVFCHAKGKRRMNSWRSPDFSRLNINFLNNIFPQRTALDGVEPQEMRYALLFLRVRG